MLPVYDSWHIVWCMHTDHKLCDADAMSFNGPAPEIINGYIVKPPMFDSKLQKHMRVCSVALRT